MKHLATLPALALALLLAACTSTSGDKAAVGTTAQVDYEGRPYAASSVQSGTHAQDGTAQTDYDGHPLSK